MKIRQLSVFIENKTGRINDVTHILGANGINMHAFSLAETADFGILRMIVSDVERAAQALRDANFAVRQTDVVCFKCPNTPGSLSAVLDVLAREQVFIEYMYAFSEGDTASIVIRPTDIDRCIDTLSRNRCELIPSRALNRP